VRIKENLGGILSSINKEVYASAGTSPIGKVFGIVTTENTPTKELFEKGVVQFSEQKFEVAIETFTKVLEIDPLDRACKIHLERCHYYAKHGVPPDWEGVVALNNK
jgi:hypothetical protein